MEKIPAPVEVNSLSPLFTGFLLHPFGDFSPDFCSINRTGYLMIQWALITMDHLSQAKDVWSWVVAQAPDAETKKKKRKDNSYP